MRYGELLHEDGTLNPMTSVCGQIKRTRKQPADGSPAVAWQADTYIARGGGPEAYTPALHLPCLSIRRDHRSSGTPLPG